MAGKRIKALVEKTSYSPDDLIAIDNNSLLEAQSVKLRLLGNAYFQGSTDNSNWHDAITGSDNFFRFSTDGGATWKPLTTNANWVVRRGGTVQRVIANGEFLNFIQGSGIQISTTSQAGGLDVTFTLDTTGNWTGTFDGQEGTYYLNYNNLTNKPSIPNPLTLDATATAGGLSIDSNQVLYFRPATTSQTGYLTATDWNTFNEKEPAITAGTGLTLTGTTFSLTDIAAGSSTIGTLTYAGTTRTSGKFYGGTTNPSGTLRLNYDGYLYATRFYGDGSNITNINYNNISNPPYIPVTKVINSTNSTAQATAAGELIDMGPGTINLHRIAKTGTYSDLIGLPTIPTVGTLTTTSSLGLSPATAESLSGSIALHRVSKTGSYADLLNKPTIPVALTLTTSGTSGAATYDSNTGILNIPNYTSSSGALPAGSASEIQYRLNGTTFGAVTSSSVSGANITLGGKLSISTNNNTDGAAFINNSSAGGLGLTISAGVDGALLTVNTNTGWARLEVMGNGAIYMGGLSSATTDNVLYYNSSTGLVTYGAAGGGGSSSPLTTKGDIYTYSTGNTRLPVGTNGQILSANSSTSTGLQWINPPSGSSIWTDAGIYAHLNGYEEIYMPYDKSISWRTTSGSVTGNNVFKVVGGFSSIDFKAGTSDILAMSLYNNNQAYLSSLQVRGSLSISNGPNAGYEDDAYTIATFSANQNAKFGLLGGGTLAQIAKSTSPPTPASGWGYWYAKTDGKAYFKNSSGEEFDLTGGGGGSGTVTSVGLSMPSIFTVTNSPVTTSGTLTASLVSQTANYVFAAPHDSNGVPLFRRLEAVDIPNLDASKTTTGVFNTARLGSGTANNTTYLRGDSTWATLPSGFADPMTTAGDIIYRNSSNVTTRLGRGAAGTVLTSDGINLSWQAVPTGSSVTANNGLTLASSNIELGGTLIKNTTINGQSSYKLSITGSIGSSEALFNVTNSNATNGVGVKVATTSGNAIEATATTGISGVFDSTTGIGLSAISRSTYGALITSRIASSSSVQEILRLQRSITTGLGNNGIGGSIVFVSPTTTNQDVQTNSIRSYWETATHDSRLSHLEIRGQNGATENILATFKGTGQLQLNQYTGTNFTTGTAIRMLTVDSSGNVLQKNMPTGYINTIYIDIPNSTGASNNISVHRTIEDAIVRITITVKRNNTIHGTYSAIIHQYYNGTTTLFTVNTLVNSLGSGISLTVVLGTSTIQTDISNSSGADIMVIRTEEVLHAGNITG